MRRADYNKLVSRVLIIAIILYELVVLSQYTTLQIISLLLLLFYNVVITYSLRDKQEEMYNVLIKTIKNGAEEEIDKFYFMGFTWCIMKYFEKMLAPILYLSVSFLTISYIPVSNIDIQTIYNHHWYITLIAAALTANIWLLGRSPIVLFKGHNIDRAIRKRIKRIKEINKELWV